MTKFYEQPLRLVWNKLVRYPGGREIDRFRGIYPGADDGRRPADAATLLVTSSETTTPASWLSSARPQLDSNCRR